MKALNTLRNLIFLLFLTAAAANASATDAPAKPERGASQPALEQKAKAPGHGSPTRQGLPAARREVAPFVDPTLPLTDLVERIRTEHAR